MPLKEENLIFISYYERSTVTDFLYHSKSTDNFGTIKAFINQFYPNMSLNVYILTHSFL